MQNNSVCYSYDSGNKTTKVITLQKDVMNDGYLPAPENTSYVDPSIIELEENETLILENEKWEKIPHHINKKLYHKINKTEMTISEIGKTPVDYPDYTDKEIPDTAYSPYYEYSEQTQNWKFDIVKYKSDASKRITAMCVTENYSILSQEKRENILAGSPATDEYPLHLQGEAGKTNIAKLNNIYQKISKKTKSDIQSADSKREVDEIILGIIFPSEAEILASILEE